MSSFFEDTCIVHESSCPYTPKQNGVAERKIGHLMEVARAMMFTSHALKHLWSEALLTAVYLVNRLPFKILSFKSPKDVFLHHYPKVQRGPELPLHIFGCVAYVHQSQPSVGKWSPRALKLVTLKKVTSSMILFLAGLLLQLASFFMTVKYSFKTNKQDF